MTDVLILGAGGQLGGALKRTDTGGFDVVYADKGEADLTNPDEAQAYITAHQPRWIVNCSGYTAVDKAESERDLAFRVNRDAVENIARASQKTESRVIHISTDFVFSGDTDRPYGPQDNPGPINVYGMSKLLGEEVLSEVIPETSIIIRTAWLYAVDGNNFVKTMLRLMSERDELSVVNDQYGTPTYAAGLARVIWTLIEADTFRAATYHWADEGVISWYNFACAIQEEALDLGLLDKSIPIHPIPTEEYPAAAERPRYSALDASKLQSLTGIQGTPWRVHLRAMLSTLSPDQ